MYRHFPPEQVKVVLFEDFKGDTRRTYESVLDFLEVTQDGRSEFPVINSNKSARNALLARFTQRPPEPLKELVLSGKKFLGLQEKSLGALKTLRKVNFVNTKREPLSPELRRKVTAAYKDDILELSNLLGARPQSLVGGLRPMSGYLRSTRLVEAVLAFAVALLLGLGLGVAVAEVRLQLVFVLAGTLGLFAAWWLVKIPALTVLAFLSGYTLQRSALYGSGVEGLYYPIYALMFLNVFLLVTSRRFKLPTQLAGIYLPLYFVMLLGLFNLYSGWDRETIQQLFIYGLGLVVFLQFTTERSFYLIYWGQALLSSSIALWTIFTAFQSDFARRGGIESDQNNVSFIIVFGLLPLVITIFAAKTPTWLKLLAWLGLGVGAYALLILASRGMTVAFVLTLLVLAARTLNLRKLLLTLVGIFLVALTLTQLPGSGGLVERFAETGDIVSAGGRVQLWGIALDVIRNSEPTELLLGHGFTASRVLVGAETLSGQERSTHNSYLQMLIDFGVVGLGLFLALHAVALRLLWRYRDALSLYALGCVVFLLLSVLTLNMADNFLYWLFLGYALAVAYFQKEHAESGLPLVPRNVHNLRGR